MQLYYTIKKLLRVSIIVYITMVVFSSSSSVWANDLIVDRVSLEEPDQSAGTAQIRFSIFWDNSWRNSTNHDAVWLFAKYSIDGGDTWRHATLASSGKDPEGFSTGTNSSLRFVVPNDRKGAFLERGAPGSGEIFTEDAEISWLWSEDGLSASDAALVRLYGIEMVYVPRGPFYAGDGDETVESLYAFHKATGDNTAVRISSSNVQVMCDSNIHDDLGSYSVTVKGLNGVDTNSDYPTGYGAFYLMKYELSEGSWVDFFNTLPAEAQQNLDITGSSGKDSDGTVYRNTISFSNGEAVTSRPYRAMGFLSWQDLCSYAAWAALRPMTELEYEKASRGMDRSPVTGEYVWGNLRLTAADEISGMEDGTETVATDDANACYNERSFAGGDGEEGPLRVGIFATSDSTREQAGAAFYGAMELSGNLRERTVSLGSVEGRAFRGSHGTGELSDADGTEGAAQNSDWPGFVEGEGVTASEGSGFRGGSWFVTDSQRLAVSDRAEASISSDARLPDAGGRAVRTAP